MYLDEVLVWLFRIDCLQYCSIGCIFLKRNRFYGSRFLYIFG